MCQYEDFTLTNNILLYNYLLAKNPFNWFYLPWLLKGRHWDMLQCTYITSHSHSVSVNSFRTLYSGNNLNFSMKAFHKVRKCVYGTFLTFFPEVHLGGEMLNLDKESKSCGRRSSRLRSGLCANHSSSSTRELFIVTFMTFCTLVHKQSGKEKIATHHCLHYRLHLAESSQAIALVLGTVKAGQVHQTSRQKFAHS